MVARLLGYHQLITLKVTALKTNLWVKHMFKKFLSIILFISGSFFALKPVSANELLMQARRCIVDSTTNKDRRVIMKFFFAAYTRHPELKSIAQASPDLTKEAIAGAAQLTDRILTKDCVKELKPISDQQGLNTAYAVVLNAYGGLAAAEFNGSPEIGAVIGDLGKQLSKDELARVYGSPSTTAQPAAPQGPTPPTSSATNTDKAPPPKKR